jgi:hypothetical protein
MTNSIFTEAMRAKVQRKYSDKPLDAPLSSDMDLMELVHNVYKSEVGIRPRWMETIGDAVAYLQRLDAQEHDKKLTKRYDKAVKHQLKKYGKASFGKKGKNPVLDPKTAAKLKKHMKEDLNLNESILVYVATSDGQKDHYNKSTMDKLYKLMKKHKGEPVAHYDKGVDLDFLKPTQAKSFMNDAKKLGIHTEISG